ncbi:MAG: CapA family protein [Paludibacteraceae bacterium]|nr:CapA family protein [Paludibacteraceae bacterium]
MKHILVLLFSLLTSVVCLAQGHHHFSLKDSTQSYVRLLFAGDAMQHSTQYKWAWNQQTRTYDYEPNFRYLRPYLAQADINIVNFETTLSGAPYAGYPKFRTPDAFLDALSDAGFQVFALANNHVLDGDKKGFARTIKKLSPYPYIGAYMDTMQRSQKYPLIFHIDGMKIALFNATYGTNGLLPVWPNCVNYIETEQLEIDLARSLQDTTIDLRIMYIHWGTEYQLKHNAYQQGVGQWLADLGIDLIIGGHPHVVQDYQVLTAKDGRHVPVVYALGNLISNQRWEHSNGGILATVDIDRATRKVIRVNYVPVYVHKGSLMKERRNYYCIPTPDYLEGKLPFSLPNDSLEQDLRLFHRNTVKRLHAISYAQ